MILTIFTPLYNRAKFLPRIYNSIVNQSAADFEWLIIDDGSTDNAGEIIESLRLRNPSFPIHYYYKENGGKHSAINYAAKKARGVYMLWLDSDDWLLPESLSNFIPELVKAQNEDTISAVVGLRLSSDFKPLGSYIPNNIIDVHFLRFILSNRVEGDYSWAIKVSILKEYPFPIYEHENFCTEGLILNRISEKYLTRFVGISVTIGSYIEGGLTQRINELTKHNPFGFLQYYKEIITSRQSNISAKIRFTVLYWNQWCKCEKPVPKNLYPTILMYMLKWPSKAVILVYNIILRLKHYVQYT